MNRECILEQAKQHDSFYLYEEAIIRKNTEQLKTDFPGVTFLYSVKCNPYPEVLRCVLNQGFGVDAASLAECVMVEVLAQWIALEICAEEKTAHVWVTQDTSSRYASSETPPFHRR